MNGVAMAEPDLTGRAHGDRFVDAFHIDVEEGVGAEMFRDTDLSDPFDEIKLLVTSKVMEKVWGPKTTSEKNKQI